MKQYIENLEVLEVSFSGENSKCIICSTITHFINVNTGNYVCSQGCGFNDCEDFKMKKGLKNKNYNKNKE